MKGFAEFFIYIGCLLSTLLLSIIIGGIFSMATGFDQYMLAWVVASGLLAIIFTIKIINEVF